MQGSKLAKVSDFQLEDILSDASNSSFIPEQHICHSDTLIYIYTSGKYLI